MRRWYPPSLPPRGRWIPATLALALAVPLAAQPSSPPKLEAVVAMVEDGRLEAAESELRHILDRGENPAARELLSGLLLRQGKNDEALVELRAAAKLGPLERELALWLADAELAQGNEVRAEVQLMSVVERYPSVRAMLQLAKLQARKGRAQEAAATLRRALMLAPNSEDVLAAHAKVSLTVDAPVVASDALEALLRMHPEVAEYHYLLGVARLQIGDLGGAIEELQRSLELEPARALSLIALGTTLSSQKRYAEARDALRRCLRLAPENAEALAALAEAEEGLGEDAQAEEHAKEALARVEDHTRALVTLGLLRMKQSKYEEARDFFLRAVGKEPKLAKAHYQLSLAYARLGDRESSNKHRELYRSARKERDERLVKLRTQAGIGNPGMGGH